jgi:hypothetical protein
MASKGTKRMTPSDAQSILPALRPLPGIAPALAASARDMARLAIPLLSASHAVLLSVTVATKDGSASPATLSWDGRCPASTLLPGIAPDDVLLSTLRAFETSGRILLTELIRRWPPNALPTAIGIVTDGSGVAFSADHPAPLSHAWLTRHLTGMYPMTTLTPFSPCGIWGRLTASATSSAIH